MFDVMSQQHAPVQRTPRQVAVIAVRRSDVLEVCDAESSLRLEMSPCHS